VIPRGICYSPVTVCVCLSATSRSFTKMAKQIELFFFAWNLPSTHHTLCCKEIRSVQKIRVLPSGTFFQTLDTEKISSRHVDRFVNKTRRRSSLLTTLTTVDESRLYAHSLLYVGRPQRSNSIRFVVDLLYNLSRPDLRGTQPRKPGHQPTESLPRNHSYFISR